MVSIYALVDPRDGEIRYVGKTIKPLPVRLREHVQDPKVDYRHNWIQQLAIDGTTPSICLLEEVTESDWQEREKWWIACYRQNGRALTNLADGGQGSAGWRHTSTTLEKIRAKAIGKVVSPTSRQKIAHSLLGRRLTQEQKSKIRIATSLAFQRLKEERSCAVC
jgi:hypothetical protein